MVGLDIAKSVFQVHGIGVEGEVVVRRRLRRSQVLRFFEKLEPCRIGIEACATAHHWARELGAIGHDVRLIPPSYVKPYVKRQKNDAADAEAICEAVGRPSMRFVPVKTVEQQSAMGAASNARAADAPTSPLIECDPRALGRVRRHRAERAERLPEAD